MSGRPRRPLVVPLNNCAACRRNGERAPSRAGCGFAPASGMNGRLGRGGGRWHSCRHRDQSIY